MTNSKEEVLSTELCSGQELHAFLGILAAKAALAPGLERHT